MTPQQMQGLIIPIGFLVVFYLFAIRPQKKKEKEIKSMRDSLKVGDEVITIGGIYGKILLAKEDKITLEVGSTKTRLDVTRWSIGSVIKSREIKQD
ncbi:preprotein translocase subunit YajC [Tissierella creatinophila]|uniref:Preprotein translocase subunit YajC n=1 Tax=Tissierella creatinophila DSM 6911 TaxID=1123403 RepID=A0A1U7M376_TISCR|nr:preprotein translocase subunit YajC [Tissierella creatinophila]OLS01669.1 preprotein translocase subunit YajC [Tissierella creatinophila DSM 6911]